MPLLDEMLDDKWNEIYGRQLPGMSPVGHHATPLVKHPTCPEHCSGRHTLDGEIACRHCGVPAYQIWHHEWLYTEGHNFVEVKAVNGAPPYRNEEPVICPSCGSEAYRT